ncbi:aryl-alcohol dehydrogenase [Mycena albidolilacea]|uniref:Aryl-alcohol dehydrogenase n=1 Tax=Mycena albidolilacea TaxID=1033008 RepID=A0AAD7F2T4_9AGAR|nr:aryl-alcohol dehydrogenase [Mycena albidolilacea]
MASPPATKLGRYRQLSPRAAIHVSPLALGTMTFGTKWEALGMRAMDKESSFKLLDAFFDAGGNHIDTANAYQTGDSERCIGEWAEARGCRDQLVIATKYTFPWTLGDTTVKQNELFLGNNSKSMKLSLEASLRKLRTTYIDIFYVHMWDLHTSVEELMDSLHILVLSGKVLYLGISDSPAWFVAKANEYARSHGKTPFVVFQVPYSVLQRDLEREIIPMCRHEGIALTLWSVLAEGHIRTDAEEERRKATGENGRTSHGGWERTEDEKKMCAALEIVAQQVGAKHITAVAIAYTMHKAPFVFPIIGGRNPEQLLANIEALDIALTPEHLAYIDGILPFDKGKLARNMVGEYGTYPHVLGRFSTFDHQPPLQPISPAVSK